VSQTAQPKPIERGSIPPGRNCSSMEQRLISNTRTRNGGWQKHGQLYRLLGQRAKHEVKAKPVKSKMKMKSSKFFPVALKRIALTTRCFPLCAKRGSKSLRCVAFVKQIWILFTVLAYIMSPSLVSTEYIKAQSVCGWPVLNWRCAHCSREEGI